MARHTLMSARSEMQSELEEMSYRWRTGRLADLGYPEQSEALLVFRPLDPASVQIGEQTKDSIAPAADEQDDRARAPGSLPVAILEQAVGRAFLAQALDRITDSKEGGTLGDRAAHVGQPSSGGRQRLAQ